MLKKILIVVATESEADALRMIPGVVKSENCYLFGNLAIDLLVTGVGSVSTSWAMMKWFSSNPRPELAINIGIAGSYSNDIAIGDVVAPVSDCFADSGMETEDGFITLSEAGMGDPFVRGGKIVSDNIYTTVLLKMLRPVSAVTVNTVTGSADTIRRITGKFNPGIETMEGAAFFYICLRERIPFAALRSISNRVEPRNRKKWDIHLAVSNLSGKLRDFLIMVE